MFAFALWDREERVLTLARDRLGEKPLYYGRMGDDLPVRLGAEGAHASTPPSCGEVDRDALALYLRHNYVPAPHSIWRGIRKLPPAHFSRCATAAGPIGEPVAYWDFPRDRRGRSRPIRCRTAPSWSTGSRPCSRTRCELRMVADVPLGAFLSGGIDSSTIVALMQAQSARPVRTFTIGFHEQAHINEAGACQGGRRAISAPTIPSSTSRPADALALIPHLPAIWDEPFADSSQIPTYLVVASWPGGHVTVSLSGDARRRAVRRL